MRKCQGPYHEGDSTAGKTSGASPSLCRCFSNMLLNLGLPIQRKGKTMVLRSVTQDSSISQALQAKGCP